MNKWIVLVIYQRNLSGVTGNELTEKKVDFDTYLHDKIVFLFTIHPCFNGCPTCQSKLVSRSTFFLSHWTDLIKCIASLIEGGKCNILSQYFITIEYYWI